MIGDKGGLASVADSICWCGMDTGLIVSLVLHANVQKAS